MRNQTTLKNPELMHIRHYQDVELIKACGISLTKMAIVLGYASPSILYERLTPYRRNGNYFTPSVSCLLESALWRLGYMSHFINAKQRQEGVEAINWSKLPEQLNPCIYS